MTGLAAPMLMSGCRSGGEIQNVGGGNRGGTAVGTGGGAAGGATIGGGTGGSETGPGTGGTGNPGNRTGGAGGARPGSGGSGSGGAPTRGPTAAQPGLRFPFPQNREQSRCSYPTLYRNEDVMAAYQQWKADNVTTDGAMVNGVQARRVKRTAEPALEPGSTVSEGIAYGMLIAVYMGDQALFDDLWKYEQGWLDVNGLMDWYINGAGTLRLDEGSATDADEDMAFALLMADRQWGGMGSLGKTYLQHAREQISKIWNFEIFDYQHIKPGDGWGDATTINISYFAPSYYRLFAQVDTANTDNWNHVLQVSYDTLARALNPASGNQDNGLVPAWCDSSGVPNGAAFLTGSPTNYQYDSCRTPFRIGLDWCMNGDTRARDYVAKTSGFFAGMPFAGIVDGYDLNGAPHAQFQKDALAQVQSASFIGPAAVGAMSAPGYRAFLDRAYTAVATRGLTVGGTYYDGSWTVLSLLMMTANFLDYTQY